MEELVDCFRVFPCCFASVAVVFWKWCRPQAVVGRNPRIQLQRDMMFSYKITNHKVLIIQMSSNVCEVSTCLSTMFFESVFDHPNSPFHSRQESSRIWWHVSLEPSCNLKIWIVIGKTWMIEWSSKNVTIINILELSWIGIVPQKMEVL